MKPSPSKRSSFFSAVVVPVRAGLCHPCFQPAWRRLPWRYAVAVAVVFARVAVEVVPMLKVAKCSHSAFYRTESLLGPLELGFLAVQVGFRSIQLELSPLELSLPLFSSLCCTVACPGRDGSKVAAAVTRRCDALVVVVAILRPAGKLRRTTPDVRKIDAGTCAVPPARGRAVHDRQPQGIKICARPRGVDVDHVDLAQPRNGRFSTRRA